VYHWDGSNWGLAQALDPGTSNDTFSGVSGVAANDVWAVGTASGLQAQQAAQSNLIEHWNGIAWQTAATPNVSNAPGAINELFAVRAIDKDDVWAVGCAHVHAKRSASILHWNGTRWSVELGPAGCLSSITAVSPNEIWAAGEQSSNHTLVLRSDGKTWQMVSSP
jgi:hypothetical protein